MQKTNALKMRQNLGKVLRQLATTGEPVIVERGRKPTAVLISIEDYEKRFVDVEADKKRREIVEKIKKARGRLPKGKRSIDLIREMRAK